MDLFSVILSGLGTTAVATTLAAVVMVGRWLMIRRSDIDAENRYLATRTEATSGMKKSVGEAVAVAKDANGFVSVKIGPGEFSAIVHDGLAKMPRDEAVAFMHDALVEAETDPSRWGSLLVEPPVSAEKNPPKQETGRTGASAKRRRRHKR